MTYTIKRKIKRFIGIALIAALLISITPLHTRNNKSVFAQSGSIENNNAQINDLQKKAAEIAAKNKERENRIADLRRDAEQYDELVGEVNEQIGQIGAQIEAYKNLIDAKQGAIDVLAYEIELKELEIENTIGRIEQREAEIERLEIENEENIEKFGQIIAQMYMNSGGDAFSLLTGSTSFYDILVRVEMIKNVGEKNAEIMENLLDAIYRQEEEIEKLQQDRQQLDDEKAELEEQRINFGNEMHELQEDRDTVTLEINAQYNALRDLTAEQEELQSGIDDLSVEVDAAADEIADINRRVQELEAANKAIEATIRDAQNAAPADRPTYSASGWQWPVNPYYPITGSFGWCSWRNGQHNGVDMSGGGISSANAVAVQAGTVITAMDGGAWNGGYGNYVVVDHGGGIATLYAHLATGTVAVGVGSSVSQGQVLGRIGNTGYSTGPHLHFEVRKNGTVVNPVGYI